MVTEQVITATSALLKLEKNRTAHLQPIERNGSSGTIIEDPFCSSGTGERKPSVLLEPFSSATVERNPAVLLDQVECVCLCT